MKKTYEKPAIKIEAFEADQYVAACYLYAMICKHSPSETPVEVKLSAPPTFDSVLSPDLATAPDDDHFFNLTGIGQIWYGPNLFQHGDHIPGAVTIHPLQTVSYLNNNAS